MSVDWPEVSIEEIAAQQPNALATGPFGSAISSKFFVAKGVPVIRGSNLSTDIGIKLNDEGLVFVSEEKAKTFSRSIVKRGDLIFTCWGTINQVGMIHERSRWAEYVISNKQMKLTVDPLKADPKFIYYVFSSPTKQSEILANSIGAAVPGFNLGQLKKHTFKLPPLGTQRNIVNSLDLLDRKIQLNHQTNQTLEQMTQAIFKSWFVDFEPVKAKIAALEAGGSEEDALLAAMQAISGKGEAELTRLQAEQPKQYAELRATAELFPSAMQDSELGEIPEGWKCLALDQIAKYQNGLALQKFRPENEDDYLPVVKIAQLKKGYADHEEKASPNIKPDCIIDNGDVVFSWSGSLMVDTWCGGRAALNQHLFKVTSENYPKWLYFHFTRHHLEEFQRIAADKAVTMGHIKREHLKRALCAIPDGEFIESAGKVLSSVLNKQIELRLESKYLSELRDALLPKLLSGELSVSETANQTLEKAEPANV